MSNVVVWVVAGLVASVLAACATAPPPPPPPVAAAAPPALAEVTRAAKPLLLDNAQSRCAAAANLAVPGLGIGRAAWVAAGTPYPPSWAARRTQPDALVEHCRIDALLAAFSAVSAVSAVSADSAAGDAAGPPQPVAIELRLPSNWNGRLLQQGVMGVMAQPTEAFGRGTGAGGFDDNALSRGFAVLAVATRPAAGAIAAPVLAAKALVAAYYGRPAGRSYHVGCGDGGRDGLRLAQAWPALFDGIVAVAPRLRETDATLAAAWTLQRFMAVAPRTGSGAPVLARAFSSDALFSVAQGILKQCDALDGAADGFVMDMAACRFDPAVLQCKSRSAAGCLAANQVKALREAMAGPRDDAGQPLYAAWPWDPGLAAPAWRAWTMGQAAPGQPPDARHLALAQAKTLAPLAPPATAGTANTPAAPAAPALNLLAFNFNRDLPRLQAARDADAAMLAAPLDAFRQLQGKLLLVHGAADPVVSAWATVAYQQRLDAAADSSGAGGAANHARSFIVPGMGHCAGGPATDRFDALGPLVDWVEQDQPPQRIEARGSAVLRDETRPLCPWPQVARHVGGSGGVTSLQASASYTCR